MSANNCKDCDKRYPGCHDHCDIYKEWHDKLRAQKKKEHVERGLNYLETRRRFIETGQIVSTLRRR